MDRKLFSRKVAWLRVDTQTILTIAHHIITKNHRISVTHTENRMWQLRIKDIKVSDQGWYMVMFYAFRYNEHMDKHLKTIFLQCQINTDPMKSQLGYLDVVSECDR